jgi:hypothetical protein
LIWSRLIWGRRIWSWMRWSWMRWSDAIRADLRCCRRRLLRQLQCRWRAAGRRPTWPRACRHQDRARRIRDDTTVAKTEIELLELLCVRTKSACEFIQRIDVLRQLEWHPMRDRHTADEWNALSCRLREQAGQRAHLRDILVGAACESVRATVMHSARAALLEFLRRHRAHESVLARVVDRRPS